MDAARMLEATVIDRAPALEALVPEWRELLGRAPRAELVLTPTWLLAWWREFGDRDGRALRVLAVRDAGKLVGLVPLSSRLAMHRRAIPVRRLELLATGEAEEHEICSDYVGALIDEGYEHGVAEETARRIVLGELGAWDELLMPAMNAEDPWVAALERALVDAGARVTLEESGRCPYIALPKAWDEYLKQLDGSRRYVVSRGVRELEKWAGKEGWKLERAADRASLEQGKRILSSLHGERWNEEGQSGVFASPRFARFHDEVMPKLLAGEDGASLDLLWLTVKGEPVAIVYNVIFRGKVYFYQSGRKLEVPKNVKPGIAVHAVAIKRAIEQGLREYDFLNGASQYKLKLAPNVRPLVTLRAVAPGLRARAVDAARTLAERLAQRVRERRRKRSGGGEPAAAAPEDHG